MPRRQADEFPRTAEFLLIKDFGIDEAGTEMPLKEVLPDETSGEEKNPEGSDQSPQQTIAPAADSNQDEGTED